jgi:thiamine phosphate synthase YjbQ (UPF0047 family)
MMDTEVEQLRTGHRLVTDITKVILQFSRDRGDGLCHVFVPHTTVGVVLIETGSGSESDLEDALDRLCCPARTFTGTRTAAAVTAVTTCCRPSRRAQRAGSRVG